MSEIAEIPSEKDMLLHELKSLYVKLIRNDLKRDSTEVTINNIVIERKLIREKIIDITKTLNKSGLTVDLNELENLAGKSLDDSCE